MSVLVVGLNHKGAPLELLERFAFDAAELPKALHAARSSEPVREAVVLSTCNRVEVYAAVDGYHGGLAALRRFLSDFHHVQPDAFVDRSYAYYEDEAVRHLFSVAAGIESMVIGEPQILGQVRAAFRVAEEEGAVGWLLSGLFRRAIHVGRRARAETAIAGSAAGLADAGVILARETLGSLAGRAVLIVGAGKMSDLAAEHIAAEGATVLVANRTHARALRLAARVGAEVIPFAQIGGALARADLVLASTGSPEPLVTAEDVAGAMRARAGRPLFLLDLAVPRDIDPAAGSIDGVVLRDLDDLRDAVAPTADQLGEIDRVRDLLAREVPRFAAWRRAHAVAPLVAALTERGEAVRAAELARARKALRALGEDERWAVEALARAIVAKLLHEPIAALKSAAGTPEGEALSRALRALWSLEERGEER